MHLPTYVHTDTHTLGHTSLMCTHTNRHWDRRSQRCRYAHTCVPGTHSHTYSHVQTLAPTGGTLSQARGSGEGAANPCCGGHLLPPGVTRPAEGARGPLPSGPSRLGRGEHVVTTLPPRPGPLCSPTPEEATVPGERFATESSGPCLVLLLLALEMSWGAVGYSAGMTATTRRES